MEERTYTVEIYKNTDKIQYISQQTELLDAIIK